MSIVDTYLQMRRMEAVSRTNLFLAGNSPAAGAEDPLSFRSTLESVQKKQASSGRLSAGKNLDSIFEEAAARYGVNADLLKAIGKAESGFNTSVVSSAGAIGVMQLMPATAQSLGVRDPYNARENIMGGAKYIAQLLDKYNGNTRLALAAYNAGPGNVDKYGGIPPFEETQNYVKRVMGYAGESLQAGNGQAPETAGRTNTAAIASAAVSGDAIGIPTDSFLTLLTLMRMQMDLRMSTMMSADSDSSNGLSSL